MKKRIYRIIRFEYDDEHDMARQLLNSVSAGIYQLGPHVQMTIVDRTTDPCERDFFENRVPDKRIRKAVITEKQLRALPLQDKEDIYL